jgi:hypothetical protein
LEKISNHPGVKVVEKDTIIGYDGVKAVEMEKWKHIR